MHHSVEVREPFSPVDVRDFLSLPVTEVSQVAQARRRATALASRLGFNETHVGNVALVVTEAATNLVKHATGGEILLYALQSDWVGGIEVLALDRGPGIANVAQALCDGYSTTGSPGTGLGAIKRLAALFDIHTVPDVGTVMLVRLWSKPLPVMPTSLLEVGAVSLPKPGEEVCGDRWAVAQFPDRTLILVADGLGHGPGAAEAALEAVQTFNEQAALTPAAILEAIHAALRSTRGAAVAVAEVSPPREEVRFAGVGNIGGLVFSTEGSRQMVSYNGTAGHAVRKIKELTYPCPADALLILYSDGLITHPRPERYPGLTKRHPDLIAATLYRDYIRGRDDATVVVARGTVVEEPQTGETR
jgi:anti-sigma regulatory factor (Ser/Thr protein kinase)